MSAMTTTELVEGPVDGGRRERRRATVDVVVPVHNEERCLAASIRCLRSYLDHDFPFDAVVTIADNASTDRTMVVAANLADELDGVRVVHLDQKGRGRALRAAWLASDAEVVAYMDVDLSTGLEALLPLVAPLLSRHSDVAIGTRLARSARVHRGTKRQLISRTYNALLHTVMHNRFSDAQCGFKAVRRDVVGALLPLVEDEGWFFDTELLLLAEHNRLRIHEVPVDWIDDPDSKVHIVHTALADLKGMLRVKREFANGLGHLGESRRMRRSVAPTARVHALVTAAIGVLAAVLYTWQLGRVGWGNAYYAAAVKSATVSWKAFFFGSLDPGSFITVDKPPAALWVQALSARIFGFSPWSLLIPEAVGGVASVLILHRVVRKWAGDVAAHLAALGLALTPVAVLMFRYNNPDALLTFLCVAAAWALWSSIETGRWRGLLLSAVLLGLAFDTKMLQALVVLPAFFLAYMLFGPLGLGRRVIRLATAGVVMLASASWWVAAVALWPAAARPYIGSTTDNSIVGLILGYNGLSRIFGNGGGGPGGGAGGSGAPSFAGAASWLRMFNPLVGGQISWLIPLAGVGLCGGLVLALRRRPRSRSELAGWTVWGGWALVMLAVFSRAEGIFHPYYTVQAAPAVAALAGAGSVALWRLGRGDRRFAFLLPAAVAGTGIWALALLDRTPGYATWLTPAVLVATAVATVALAAGLYGRRQAIALAGACAGAFALLAGPAAYSLTTIANPASGALASAGPSTVGTGGAGFGPAAFALRTGTGSTGTGATLGRGAAPGVGSGPGGSSTASKALVSYLESHRGGAEYIVAGFTSSATDSIIIESGDPVVTIGGFNGSDPTPTLAGFVQMVRKGEVRYVLISGSGGLGAGVASSGFLPVGGGSGGFGPPPSGGAGAGGGRGGAAGGPGGSRVSEQITQWVLAHGHEVTVPGNTGGDTLYQVGAVA
jgi:4-amino-4-deoxy-L-arabinose transferase-like glycosyltransferase/glycosyltransferase involved in cell wall biosynthesis